MYDWENFDVVFQAKPDYAYEAKLCTPILRHREELGGVLFFDRIWANLGLSRGIVFEPSCLRHEDANVAEAAQSYPPRTNNDLRGLFGKIVQSACPEHQRQALIFYILKDCRGLHNADSNFVRRVYLPEKYQTLICGLWELDHCQFARALEHLTDPTLTPTFTDEILSVLVQHPKCDNALAMAYYITASPPLENETTLHAYFSLLTRNNVAEAYHFTQRQPLPRRRALFEDLLVAVHSEAAGEARSDGALVLVSLPFTTEEEGWFEECLLYGRGAQCPQAKDSVLLRRIGMGKDHSGVGALDRLRGPKVQNVNWDDIRIGLQKAANA